MTSTPAPEFVVTRNGRGRAACRAGHEFLCLLVIMASMAGPAYAADSSDAAAGYYGQYYEPGGAAAATAPRPRAAPGEPQAEAGSDASTNAPPQRYVAPDAYGLDYQPGFHGCAPSARINSDGMFRSALAPLPQRLGKNGNRHLRAGLSVGETYTDNIELASDDEAESAYVTQVIPSLDACADSGRIKGSLDYQLQALYYADSKEANEIYNNAAGATTIEVLPGHLFMAADSSYGQAVINPFRTFSESNVLRPGNRTSAWITNVSPYWFQRLGRIGRATLRYRYGRAEYGSSEVPDYTLQGMYLNVSNPLTDTRWTYHFNVDSLSVDRSGEPVSDGPADDRDVTHYDQATLRLGYDVTESLQLFATGGAENDFNPDGTVDRYGSALWNVGFRWASPSNSLEASVGHRAFGSTYSVEARHRGAGLDLALRYSEDTTGPGLNQLNRGGFSAVGSFPKPVGTLQDNGVYVSKRLSAIASLDTARTRTTLSAYDESRDYVLEGVDDEDVYGGTLTLAYQLGARTRLVPQVGWEHRRTKSNEASIGLAGARVVYQLSSSSQAAFGYLHGWRDGETDADSYGENRIVAQYSVYF